MSVVLSLVSCVTLLYALCFIIKIKLTKETRWRVWNGRDKRGRGLEWERLETGVKRLFTD